MRVKAKGTLLPDDCYHLPVTSSDGHFNLEKIDNFFEKNLIIATLVTSLTRKKIFKKVGNFISSNHHFSHLCKVHVD